MNIKQIDNRLWSRLDPELRHTLRRHYRLIRRKLHMERAYAHCVVMLSAGACEDAMFLGRYHHA